MLTVSNGTAIQPCNYSTDSLNTQAAPSPQSLGAQVEQIRLQTGIVPAHLVPLQQLAQQYNVVIGIRPVDPLATDLIEAGHPTKDFHIKGKSASLGSAGRIDLRGAALQQTGGLGSSAS